jgi:hypothetical protein
MTKAKSIIALLIVAMIMLWGVLVRTFFTSSPVYTLELVLFYGACNESPYSYGELNHNLDSVNYLEIRDWSMLYT